MAVGMIDGTSACSPDHGSGGSRTRRYTGLMVAALLARIGNVVRRSVYVVMTVAAGGCGTGTLISDEYVQKFSVATEIAPGLYLIEARAPNAAELIASRTAARSVWVARAYRLCGSSEAPWPQSGVPRDNASYTELAIIPSRDLVGQIDVYGFHPIPISTGKSNVYIGKRSGYVLCKKDRKLSDEEARNLIHENERASADPLREQLDQLELGQERRDRKNP